MFCIIVRKIRMEKIWVWMDFNIIIVKIELNGWMHLKNWKPNINYWNFKRRKRMELIKKCFIEEEKLSKRLY